MAEDDKKELWVAWTHDALARYSAPDDVDDVDELVDDMAETAAKYADVMLEEYEERFRGGTARQRRKKKVDPEEDD